jgi:uncharacterized lipoprotein YddW (UPF0748 family)
MKVAASSSSTCVPSFDAVLRYRARRLGVWAVCVKAALVAAFCWLSAGQAWPADTLQEVRGTWLTTTANDAIATPARTAATMRRLREIGINTVYVEVWKNGYT